MGDFATTGLPAPTRLVWIGDSITAGESSSPPPTLMQVDLGSSWYVVGAGVGGNTVGQMYERWPAIRALEYAYLVILGGVNDLRAGTAAADIWADSYLPMITQAGALYQIRLCTVLPWKNSGLWAAGYQTETEALNELIRDWCADNVTFAECVDAYAEMGGADPAALLAAYDSGDGLHPGLAGSQKLADLVRASL